MKMEAILMNNYINMPVSSLISYRTFTQSSLLYKRKPDNIHSKFTLVVFKFTKKRVNFVFFCWSELVVNIEGFKVNVVFCVFSCWSECLNIVGAKTYVCVLFGGDK